MRATIAILAGLAALLALLSGCGITGGSIPPPPAPRSASVSGVVSGQIPPYVRPPTGGYGGTVVTLSGLPVAALQDGQPIAESATDADGSFRLAELADGAYTLSATPHGGALLAPVAIPFRVADGRGLYFAVTLRPLGWTGQVKGLEVAPAEATVAVGDTVSFQPTVYGGKIFGSPVSWIIENEIGTITPGGRFTAWKAGTGTVTAYIDDFTAVAHVTVE